jgi:hypothetical protein
MSITSLTTMSASRNKPQSDKLAEGAAIAAALTV